MDSKKKLSENAFLFDKPEESKIEKSKEISITGNHEDFVKLLQELQFKEIELELKNEELERFNNDLEKSVKNYSDFFNSSLVGNFTVKDNGIIVNVNKAGAELLGLTEEELKQKSIYNFISRASKMQFDAMLLDLFTLKTRQKLQLNLISTSGELVNTTTEVSISSVKEYNLSVLPSTSERRLKSLAENTPDIIIRFNKDLRITYINSEVEKITGKPSHYYLGKTKEELGITKELYQLWYDTIRKASETRSIQELEFDFPAKEGKKIFNLRIVAETNDEGEIDSFLGFVRDITHHKEWEKTLQENENNFKYAESIAHLGSFQHNITTDICTWSDEFFRICGFEPQSFIPDFQNFLSVIHPDDKELVKNAMQNAIQNKVGYKHECRLLLPDGQIRYLVDIGHIITSQNDKAYEIKGVIQDVTELKLVELSLKDSEDNLKMLFESMPVGMAITNSKGKIIYGNKKSRILLGFSRTELKERIIDISCWKFIDKDKKEISLNDLPINQVINENRIIDNIVVGIIKNNNLTWLNVTAAPMQNPEEILIAFIDISEQVQRENQLKELTEKLKELNATKDKFFSIIAHDLKNPFNSILGFSELLIKNIHKYRIEEIERFMGIINSTSQNAYNLLENLLNWSRSQTGTIEFSPQYYNFVEIIANNIEFVENLAVKKSIKIAFDATGNYLVEIDKNMIDTVLRNILTNAIKFSYPGGKINISLESINSFYKISVKDNGIGIEEENIDKLFRIDSKYSSYGTNQEKGSGLGLIISKEFIEKNKGQIWAKSEFGKGSEFIFTLPGIIK